VGTWKLDIAKSEFTPAVVPVKSLTVTREASGSGVKVTTTGWAGDIPIHSTYTVNYDGEDGQATGNAPYDTVSLQQSGANDLTENRRKTGGVYNVTVHTVISDNGKTMTETIARCCQFVQVPYAPGGSKYICASSGFWRMALRQ
jgi:hypothetical protein